MQPFVKAVRALFNASLKCYLMNLCRICVADEICASLEILPTTENRDMKTLIIPVALLLALSVPALAQVATTARPIPVLVEVLQVLSQVQAFPSS